MFAICSVSQDILDNIWTMNMGFSKDILKRLFLCILTLFVCCEYMVYYLVIYQCSWPLLDDTDTFKNGKVNIDNAQSLRVMILSDPHLLGSENGHWFDKLRREWQMKRSFQTAMTFLRPEAVFVLGDIFDEGMICSDKEWKYYVSRFWDIFDHSVDVQFHLVPGNHDIGFHYRMLSKLSLSKRFEEDFNASGVSLINLKGNTFILVNSMAFEQDGCSLCTKAENELQKVTDKLKCLHKDQVALNLWKKRCEIAPPMSDPILLQHFPLYRSSEVNCTGKDSPPPERRAMKNRPGWEVLSQSASELLLSSFQPRLVFSGHTHHNCHRIHKGNIEEFTLPSFSWRNRNDPSFIMATLNPNAYSIKKCYLPEENTVILLYIFLGSLTIFYICWIYSTRHYCCQLYKRRTFYHREPVKIW